MTFDIIIPHRNSNHYRERNLKFVLEYYLKALPNSNIIVCEQNTETDLSEFNGKIIHKKLKLNSRYFNKSYLINEAFRNVKSDIFAIIDSDCIVPVQNLVKLDDPIYFLYSDINYLSESITRYFIKTDNIVQHVKPNILSINRYTGGALVITKDLFQSVNGFNDEIYGWGKEDDVFITKVIRSGYKIKRLDGTLLHLYHPKENYTEYLESPRYLSNCEILCAIKRITDEEFDAYLSGLMSLDSLIEIYKKAGKLELSHKIKCGNGYVKIDTSAYDIKTKTVKLDGLLKAVYTEDGVIGLKNTIKLITNKLSLSEKEYDIIEKYSKYEH